MPSELCTGSQLDIFTVAYIISKLEISAKSICMHCEIWSVYSEEDSLCVVLPCAIVQTIVALFGHLF